MNIFWYAVFCLALDRIEFASACQNKIFEIDCRSLATYGNERFTTTKFTELEPLCSDLHFKRHSNVFSRFF